MQAFKVGKFVTSISIIVLLIIAVISPYNLPKKIYFIVCVLVLGGISLGINKIFARVHSKYNKN